MNLTRTLALMSLFSLLFGFARAEPLKVGDAAPAVSAQTDEGKTLNLADVYKKNAYTLVWFYPKASTPGCTAQGCSLRDANAELTKKGVAIVGVSIDPVADNKKFKDEQHFPFTLLSDTDKTVVKAFGQAGTNRAAREAYLINKEGKIIYKDTGVTAKQAENVLAFLNSQKS